MKKLITFATTASLLAGSVGVTAYGSVFADINTVPWSGAATFIDEAASLGLMNGYNENGKKYCKPRNNVTYCEAVQLMYSVMKVYYKQDVSETVVTKWKPILAAYNIPAWAYSATSYALENGILSTNDLNKLKNGTEYANREDVGIIFGKALDRADGYDIVADPTLTYKDAARISATAKPYLDLLKKASLMVGDDQNNFNPQAKINRAEMAVLSVKSYKKMASDAANPVTPAQPSASGTATGTVVNSMVLSNGDLFLSMKLENGTGLNVFGAKNSVTPTFEGSNIAFSDIGTGDTVKITYAGDQMKTLEVTKSVKGIRKEETYELSKITSTKITVKDGSKDKDYRLASGAELQLDGKKSSVSSISDALEDTKYNVTLTYDKDGYVTKAVVVKNGNNPTKGLVTRLTEDDITIKAGSKSYTYTLTEGVDVKYNGGTMTFTKLKNNYDRDNYEVSLKLNAKGQVTTITVEYMEDETHGTLTNLISRRVEIKAGGETYKYDIDDVDDIVITIDGKKASFSKLKDTYSDTTYLVALDVNKDGYVTKIVATTKNAENAKGTLKKVTNSEIVIQVNKKDITHKLASDVDVTINNKNKALSDLKNNYSDYTFEVELTFNSNNRVTKINAKVSEIPKGTLKDINEDKETITVKAAGVDSTFSLTSSAKIYLDGSSITLSKLNKELDKATTKDPITVKLEYNSNGKVTKLDAQWEEDSASTAKGILREITDDEWHITIKKTSSSKATEYEFAGGDIDVTLDGRDISLSRLRKELADLDSDQEIKVTLTLNSDGEVKKVKAETVDAGDEEEEKPERGYLTKVTVSSDKITIKKTPSASATYTWNTTGSVKVVFDINRTKYYDEDDYDADLSGLKAFLSDCDNRGDDCYVKLDTNSSGKVTKITASDE